MKGINVNSPAARLRHVRFLVFVLAALCSFAGLIVRGKAGSAPQSSALAAPVLLTQTNSTRGIALDSVTELSEPFALNSRVSFGVDDRTRVMLFATNLSLAPGEDTSAVTAVAEDGALFQYPLTVEYVGAVPGYEWMTTVVVRLPDNLGDVGDVLVAITYQGLRSNRVRVGIGHLGGGPPDDPTPTPTPTPSPTPTPAPTPDLGSGASLHGKQLFPADNPWNQDISTMPVDPNSANLIASIGLNTGLHPDFGTVYNGAPNGIPYIVV